MKKPTILTVAAAAGMGGQHGVTLLGRPLRQRAGAGSGVRSHRGARLFAFLGGSQPESPPGSEKWDWSVRPGHDRASGRRRRARNELVRERATEFGARLDRIGMIGFSAGGIVTTELPFGPAATRPDFVAIIYGSGELRTIPDLPPPRFLAVAGDDAMMENTLARFTAYRNGKGVAELHVFQMGSHGFVNKGGGADHFMDRLEEWLRANKVLASK